MTDTSLIDTLSTPQVVALTLFGEARGEPIEGKVAVGSVIRNRVNARRFGADYRAVCLRPWQFSCWQPAAGQGNYDSLLAAARTLVNGGPMGPALRECVWVADGILSDTLRDRVKGATHYLTTELLATRPPAWTYNAKPICVVGSHAFYVGIA